MQPRKGSGEVEKAILAVLLVLVALVAVVAAQTLNVLRPVLVRVAPSEVLVNSSDIPGSAGSEVRSSSADSNPAWRAVGWKNFTEFSNTTLWVDVDVNTARARIEGIAWGWSYHAVPIHVTGADKSFNLPFPQTACSVGLAVLRYNVVFVVIAQGSCTCMASLGLSTLSSRPECEELVDVGSPDLQLQKIDSFAS